MVRRAGFIAFVQNRRVLQAGSRMTSPHDIQGQPSSLRSLLRFLGAGIVAWLGVGVVAALVLGFVELSIAAFLQLFLHSVGVVDAALTLPDWAPQRLDTLDIAMVLMVIAVLRAAGQFMLHQASGQSNERLNARLRRLALFGMTRDVSGAFVPAAEVNAQLADTFPKAAWAANYGAAMIGAAVQAVVLAGLLIATSVGEAALGIAGLGVVGILALAINRRIRQIASAIPAEQTIINDGIQRIARNFVLIRVLRTHLTERRRLTSAVETFRRHAIAAGQLSSLAYALTPLLGTLLLTVIIVLSQNVFRTPGMQLVAFLYLFVRFVQSLATCVQNASATSQFMPQFRASWDFARTFSDDEVVQALENEPVRPPAGATLVLEPPAITLRDVWFRYPSTTRDVVEGLSESLGSGEHLAIVGPSGCGKSTLLLLMLGVLEPTRGAIEIAGGRPADALASGRLRVGYVGAEPFLIAGTIRENLLYGIGVTPSEDQIAHVLDITRMSDVVARMPGGLQFRLSENGAGLSAGQQQRICLARALLNEPYLLILDEVSANLDAQTEDEIADAVHAIGRRCTIVVVTHRPGMLKHVDRVIDLSARRHAA